MTKHTKRKCLVGQHKTLDSALREKLMACAVQERNPRRFNRSNEEIKSYVGCSNWSILSLLLFIALTYKIVRNVGEKVHGALVCFKHLQTIFNVLIDNAGSLKGFMIIPLQS